ncbi:uncharacterized protein BO97DRAFT_413364 [Aspergillus homomorphus CBS 101889]|uniref:Uncharacterized protein n=1 Tax=Aspergillus homomorphus (strain CBS 101889) TaxID=1450537 RepID=A0A395I109_ASPHC|nr:hypothetical protein BO97DRAFT_413364 [Aspergillus homomorphus CBS 101889]RAL13369.1 hypothetical protein BO97DRAFT_413364 [Aspergillus homomorphus CBS 101889]
MEKILHPIAILKQANRCTHAFQALDKTVQSLPDEFHDRVSNIQGLAKKSLREYVREGLHYLVSEFPILHFSGYMVGTRGPYALWDYRLRNSPELRQGILLVLQEVQNELEHTEQSIKKVTPKEKAAVKTGSSAPKQVEAWLWNLSRIRQNLRQLVIMFESMYWSSTYPAMLGFAGHSFYLAIRSELGRDVAWRFRQCIQPAILKVCPILDRRPDLLRRLVDLVVQRREYWNFYRRMRGQTAEGVLKGTDLYDTIDNATNDIAFTSPFCFFQFAESFRENRENWLYHVMSDLEGYVCIYGTCPSSKSMPTICSHSFLTYTEWFDAMTGPFVGGAEWCSKSFSCDGAPLEELGR